MQDRRLISKSFLYFTFAIEITAWELAIALVILLGAQGYVGFGESIPITVTCTSTYFTSKYGGLRQMIGTAFIGSIVAMVALTFGFVVLLVWVVRVCKEGNPTTSVGKFTKLVLYLLANVGVLSVVPACGYYLTLIVELNNCTASYSPTQLIAIFVIAALLLAFSLVYFILILFVLCKDRADDSIYRDVQSNPTEPQELVVGQPYDKKWAYKGSSPPRQGSRGQNVENTKENLFQQPDRAPNIVYSYKEREPHHQEDHQQSNKKSPQESNIYSKYMSPESSHYISPTKKAVQNSKLNRRIEDDDQEFQVERNRYMNKFQEGSILPSRGLEQKSPYDRKGPAYNPSAHKRPESPPRRMDHETALISHIRGKYAN